MKPANFPERKNRRRHRACMRINKKYKGKEMPNNVELCLENTKKKLKPNGEMREIRTKKRRTK